VKSGGGFCNGTDLPINLADYLPASELYKIDEANRQARKLSVNTGVLPMHDVTRGFNPRHFRNLINGRED